MICVSFFLKFRFTCIVNYLILEKNSNFLRNILKKINHMRLNNINILNEKYEEYQFKKFALYITTALLQKMWSAFL